MCPRKPRRWRLWVCSTWRPTPAWRNGRAKKIRSWAMLYLANGPSIVISMWYFCSTNTILGAMAAAEYFHGYNSMVSLDTVLFIIRSRST